MSEYSAPMRDLMRELDKRGVPYEASVDETHRVYKERVRFRIEGHEVSVIWGCAKTANGCFGISYGWPGLLEAALFRYDSEGFRFVEDPEPMTVQEIIRKYLEGR